MQLQQPGPTRTVKVHVKSINSLLPDQMLTDSAVEYLLLRNFGAVVDAELDDPVGGGQPDGLVDLINRVTCVHPAVEILRPTETTAMLRRANCEIGAERATAISTADVVVAIFHGGRNDAHFWAAVATKHDDGAYRTWYADSAGPSRLESTEADMHAILVCATQAAGQPTATFSERCVDIDVCRQEGGVDCGLHVSHFVQQLCEQLHALAWDDSGAADGRPQNRDVLSHLMATWDWHQDPEDVTQCVRDLRSAAFGELSQVIRRRAPSEAPRDKTRVVALYNNRWYVGRICGRPRPKDGNVPVQLFQGLDRREITRYVALDKIAVATA